MYRRIKKHSSGVGKNKLDSWECVNEIDTQCHTHTLSHTHTVTHTHTHTQTLTEREGESSRVILYKNSPGGQQLPSAAV
jgi:hypothetical protein